MARCPRRRGLRYLPSAEQPAGWSCRDLDAPVVAKTSVGPDLLQSFEVFTKLGPHVVGAGLPGLTGLPLALPVEEPLGNVELFRVLDDGYKLLHFVVCQLARPLVRVHLCLFADQVRESLADTADGAEGDEHLEASINVCVQNTQNVLEIRAAVHK